MKNVYTIGGKIHSSFLYALGFKETNFNEADVIMFTGGEDVSPSYYGEPVGKYTYNNIFRDTSERELFSRAIENKKAIVGICRGFQAIHAFQGFPLIQHMDNHNGRTHKIIALNGEYSFDAPGDHHQNPLPAAGMDILARSDIESRIILNGFNLEIPLDIKTSVEIGWYPSIKALGFQYHPEWSDPNSECFIQTQSIFKKCYMIN